MRRIGSVIILLLLLFQLLVVFVPPATQTSKAWWNSNWAYYKVCYINTNGYSGYYQMKLNVSYNGGGNVSCEGHCQPDFDDIRFVDIDNTTVLPYWKETYVDSQYAIFWVNVSADAMGDGKILMYYGNPSATDESDGDETFLFFDDFEGTSINTSKWGDHSGGLFTVSNGVLTVKNNGGDTTWRYIYHDLGAEYKIRALARARCIDDGSRASHAFTITHTTLSSYDSTPPDSTRGGFYHTDKYAKVSVTDHSDVITNAELQPYTLNTWYRFFIKYPNSGYIYSDDYSTTHASFTEVSGTFYNLRYIYLQTRPKFDQGAQTTEWDFIAVMKYADTEPIWSSFGDEESQGWVNSPPTITNEYPCNGSILRPLSPNLSVQICDNDGNATQVWLWTSEDGGNTWTLRNSTVFTNGNGTITYKYEEAKSYNTTYYWKVSANDSHANITKIFHFKTYGGVDTISIPKARGFINVRISPQAVYCQELNRTYIVYFGKNYEINITYFDHDTGMWASPVTIDTIPQDVHLAPAMIINNSGYIYVWYGSHNSVSELAISNNPHDISSWTLTTWGPQMTYPLIVKLTNGTIFVFYRDYDGFNDRSYCYKISYDGGNTWTDETEFIQTVDGGLGEVYLGDVFYDPYMNRLHFVWVDAKHIESSDIRRDVFYAYMNLSNRHIYDIEGNDVGITVNYTEMSSTSYKFLVYDSREPTGAGDRPVTSPRVGVYDNIPYITFTNDNGTEKKIMFTFWNGTDWQTPVKIREVNSQVSASYLYVNSSSDIDCYISVDGLEKWHYNGTAWQKEKTIIHDTAFQRTPFQFIIDNSTGTKRYCNSLLGVFSSYPNIIDYLYTYSESTNAPPTISNPQPANNSANVPVTLSQLSVEISDPNGDLMDWTIETSPNIGSSSGNNAEDGTITCPVSGLQYGTTYTWYVNVTDGNFWTNKTYTFTTRDQYIPDPPSSFTATAVSSSQIDLSWNKGAKADTTYIERNTVSSWNRGEGTLIYNGTGTSYSDTGLSSGTTYYYQAWSYNATDNVYSSTYSSASATTTGSATVVTNESTGVEETNATLRGYLEDDGGENCSVGFDYGYTTSYGNWVLVDPSANTGEEFSYPLISIYPGTVYHYRATASNSNGTVYGADKMFLTKPYEPTSLTATSDSEDSISLSWTKGNGADKTVIVRKTGSYPTSITDGTVVYNDTGTSYTDTGLSAGTDYYYRAWSYVEDSGLHQYSDGYASAMNYTYPNKPTSVSSSATPTSITLSWTKGNGADYTVIRYSTSGYPSSLSEGTLAYNDTGTSTTISGLTPDTTYYFSFWAYDSESGYYSQEYTTHTATTPYVPPDPSNLVATTVNDTKISLTWSASTDVNSVLVRKVGNYPSSPSDGTVIFNSSGTSYVDTGLTPSTHYYYRVWTYNQGVYSENYAEDDAWTYPQPPQDVDYTLESSGTTANLTITWTKGQGADKTVIRKSANSFPSSPSDGILVYNGTGESYTDANIDQMWYYRLWSYNEESGLYSEGVNLTFFACWLNCYNETTGEAISNWSVFISDMNGSQVYTAENLQNSHILNSSQLPQGLVSFKFTADGYKFRLYYYEITSEKSLTINAYLPPESANLYMLYVKDVFGSPVRGALISVRHYNPASDTYVEVARLYTDAEGRAGVYLVPGDMYKIVISKEGYQTGHSDFTPLAELYTAEFTLLGSGEGVELPEGLWDNITLSIRPSQTHFNESTNLTVYFNISCSSGELEWYRIEVYKIRNLTQTETLLYSKSESNPYGGNLSYNIGSEVGTYKVVCTFKKQNFSAVSFERDYYIYEEKLPSMSIIPPHVYVIILIFLALAAMAFLMRLGAGDLSPIAGIIVFIIGFLIYPVTIAGVSCWFMVAAMGIGYGAYMFIRSGV